MVYKEDGGRVMGGGQTVATQYNYDNLDDIRCAMHMNTWKHKYTHVDNYANQL